MDIATVTARDPIMVPESASDADWVRLDDMQVFFGASSVAAARDAALGRSGLEVNRRKVTGDLRLVVQTGRAFQQAYPEVEVVVDKGRYLVVALPEDQQVRSKAACYAIRRLVPGTVVFRTLETRARRRAAVPWIESLVRCVDLSSFQAVLAQLTAYPTRHSTSSHFDDAAAWAQGELDAIGYVTSVQPFSWTTGASSNLVAERAGQSPPPRSLVLVTAHLDSVNTAGGPTAPAPGADDNASGCAALLQLARVFSDHPATHDLRLVLFGGEEQGLRGSAAYVDGLSAEERGRIVAVINMDMVGCRNTGVPTVLLEGDTLSQGVIDGLADAAATYTTLAVQTSLSPYASDHVSFINADIPAVLTIEGADRGNSAVHTANDTPDRIDYGLGLQIAQMNVAAAAAALGNEGGGSMTDMSTRLSGRYVYNGGADARGSILRNGEVLGDEPDPSVTVEQPIFIAEAGEALRSPEEPRFTIHIDIDGTDPLQVVSGTVSRGPVVAILPPHFIGRVRSTTGTPLERSLVVEDFSFTWPGTGAVIDRIEAKVAGGLPAAASAVVTFISTATGTKFGPYTAPRQSAYFHDVEVEIDREDGAVAPEPFNTHTHPDRPANLLAEDLTLESCFARAGIRITRSTSGNVINTTEAGANNRWNYMELHDAMSDHWSAFANLPQWKLWIFLAELADDDGLGGAMFDGYIDEPGGVDRQGTALFTLSPFFHKAAGAYPKANPPAAEAARRELFFDLIHETGHAFNLAHSFQKQSVSRPGDVAWPAPAWMPLTANPQALSWMNYPDEASPGGGYSATWFYNQFRFRFDDNENLFLRHAPASFVQMGHAAWFYNHGRVARGTLDRRLELVIRSRTEILEFGEPVFIELRLRNVGDELLLAHRNLQPSDGMVEIAVTNPSGERRPFIPFTHTRRRLDHGPLAPGETVYDAVNLTMGQFGFVFKEPGPYRIEASYTNRDGSTAAAIMRLDVRPPGTYEQLRVVQELFHARVGRVLDVGGSRLMSDVNDKLAWVVRELGGQHPASLYLTTVQAAPLARDYKILTGEADRVEVLPAEPDVCERELAPVVDQAQQAADALGHITFREVVDIYTDAAVAAGEQSKARTAQSHMLGIFESREVVAPVIEEIRKRVATLS
jgi:hypothetical protein